MAQAAPPATNIVDRSLQAAAGEANELANAPDRAGAHRPLLRSQQRLADRLPRPAVLRGFQLDGSLLDKEIHKVLARQLGEAATAVHEDWAFRLHDELGLGLSLLLYWLSVWRTNQSFGDQMMNLVFRSEPKAAALGMAATAVASLRTAPTRGQKLLHCGLTVLLPFAFRKVHQRALDNGWAHQHGNDHASARRRRVARLLRWVEGAVSLLSAVNFLAFMVEGRYRGLGDRLAQMRLVAGRQRMTRLINVDFLNQQVFWSVVLQFVSFALPLLRLHKWRSMLGTFRRTTPEQSTHGDQCAACGATPVAMPRLAVPCRHHFCYYCIATRLRDGGGTFRCPQCHDPVTACTELPRAAQR